MRLRKSSGLVGHWKFNEKQGLVASDSSRYKNHGAITLGSGKWQDKGLLFDGAATYVNAGSGASLNNLPAFTAEAWINPITMGESDAGRIFHKAANAGNTTGWLVYVSKNVNNENVLSFLLDYATTDLQRYSAGGAITTGVWQHVVVVWGGSATATNLKFYVNGIETGYGTGVSGVGARVDDTASSLTLGNRIDTNRAFNGTIDEVRIYNRALSANEILKHYNANKNKYI